ncbi:hypothetical protein ACP6JD_000080 [Aspergillus fumigatus]
MQTLVENSDQKHTRKNAWGCRGKVWRRDEEGRRSDEKSPWPSQRTMPDGWREELKRLEEEEERRKKRKEEQEEEQLRKNKEKVKEEQNA